MRLPFSPIISRVEPLQETSSGNSRESALAETHQEKSSICQKLTRGKMNEKKGMAKMYNSIHPVHTSVSAVLGDIHR